MEKEADETRSNGEVPLSDNLLNHSSVAVPIKSLIREHLDQTCTLITRRYTLAHAAEEAAARAKSITQPPDQAGVTDPDVPQGTRVHPQGDGNTTPDRDPGPRGVAGTSGTGEGKNFDKDQTSKEDASPSLGSAKSPMKRPSQTKTGASKPKKSVGDDPRKSVGDDPRRDHEIPYDKGKDQEMPSSPSSVDSLSFGSDSEFMSDMYTIVDAEVRKNGSLVLESLLHPGLIQDVTATLVEEVTNITVFFPTFTRYFLAKGRSFEMMVADLLRHRESNQNGGEPLILRADVQRLRDIANRQMRFAKQTYRMYKEMVPQQTQDNMQLIRIHMKTCMKHYHALLPQLDLIATQWGIKIDDTLAQDDEGSLRSEAARERRTTILDSQLREQIRDIGRR
jgi:hypothetical protein